LRRGNRHDGAFYFDFFSIALLFDRQFGFLKETLVAPVPRLRIMIGRTLGGATVAMLQGTLILIVCLMAGLRPVSLATAPFGILFMALIAIVFAALGTAIGSGLQDMQGFQLIMTSDAADFFPVRRIIPFKQPTDGAVVHHAP